MQNNIDFAKTKAKTDEWFTPSEAVYPILKYIIPNTKIWCPFDTEESNFVKIFREKGFNVIASHLSNGKDFFDNYVECDYIISNPPYSKRNKILIKLFSFKKPFAMLMNTNGLFDSSIRWDLFKNNNFTLIYIKGRVNYMTRKDLHLKSSPPFQSAYICSKISEKQIIFQEKDEVGVQER